MEQSPREANSHSAGKESAIFFLLVVYLTTLFSSKSDHIASNKDMINKDELERIRKEVAVA
jgi:hypothetical protein